MRRQSRKRKSSDSEIDLRKLREKVEKLEKRQILHAKRRRIIESSSDSTGVDEPAGKRPRLRSPPEKRRHRRPRSRRRRSPSWPPPGGRPRRRRFSSSPSPRRRSSSSQSLRDRRSTRRATSRTRQAASPRLQPRRSVTQVATSRGSPRASQQEYWRKLLHAYDTSDSSSSGKFNGEGDRHHSRRENTYRISSSSETDTANRHESLKELAAVTPAPNPCKAAPHTGAAPPEPKPAEAAKTRAEPPPQPESEAAVNAADIEKLNDNILELLGDDPTAEKPLGKDIHKDIAVRFSHIATNGLTKELRKDLKEKYLIPANCTSIDAPALNPELKAGLPEILIKRSHIMELRQKQLAIAASCILQTLNQLLMQQDQAQSDENIIKPLIDAGRLICDIQHDISVTRRIIVFSTLRKDWSSQIKDTKIGKFLFGENLSETLKTAKAIKKSGTELKAPKPNTPYKNKNKSSQKNLNWKAPPSNRRPMKGVGSRTPAKPRQRSQHGYSSRNWQHPPNNNQW